MRRLSNSVGILQNLAGKGTLYYKEFFGIGDIISTSFLLLHSLNKKTIKKGSLIGFESNSLSSISGY
jgi:hypothetical protein